MGANVSEPTPTPTADAPPVTDGEPKPTQPKTPPAPPEFNYPADTPLADMTAEQQSEYWRDKAQKHEKLWKSADVNPRDLEALREKARRFEEFEESQKTEQQRFADAAAKAEAKAAETAAELARVKAAVKHGLTEDDLDLLGTHGTPEEIDARAEKLAARIKAADAAKPKPDFGGGDRGGDIPSSDSLDGQIEAATKAGNIQLAIALKQQRAAQLAEKKS